MYISFRVTDQSRRMEEIDWIIRDNKIIEYVISITIALFNHLSLDRILLEDLVPTDNIYIDYTYRGMLCKSFMSQIDVACGN